MAPPSCWERGSSSAPEMSVLFLTWSVTCASSLVLCYQTKCHATISSRHTPQKPQCSTPCGIQQEDAHHWATNLWKIELEVACCVLVTPPLATVTTLSKTAIFFCFHDALCHALCQGQLSAVLVEVSKQTFSPSCGTYC